MRMITSPFTWQSLRQENFLLVGRLMPASNCSYLIRYGTSTWPFKVCSLIIDAWMYNSNWNWNLQFHFCVSLYVSPVVIFHVSDCILYFIKKIILVFVIWNAHDSINSINQEIICITHDGAKPFPYLFTIFWFFFFF